MNLLNKLFIIVGFIAAQRFALSEIYHFMPVFPLLIAAIQAPKSSRQTGIFVMIALFFTSDLGGETYNATVPALRQAIYLAAIGALILSILPRIRGSNGAKIIILVTLVCLTTMAYSIDGGNVQSSSTALRDILIVCCICICLLESKEEAVDIRPLYYATLGYLSGEVINLSFFFDRATHAYMSFNSLKVFVIFPLFYNMHLNKTRTPFTIILAVSTLLVMLAYNSKMVFFSLAFALLFIALIIVIRKPALIGQTLISILLLFTVYQFTLVLFPDVEANRILSFLSEMGENQSLLDTLEYLEPVRFHQHYLFFSRDILEIVFGSGIGAGIDDSGGQLMLVANETAFTLKEMQESRYYNFHDIWIDFGLRFGLVTLAFILFSQFRILLNPASRVLGIVFFMLLINATFSILGLLMAALFYKIILQRSMDPKINSSYTKSNESNFVL